MTPKLIYLAGKYRGLNAWEVEENIREAERWGVRIAALGAYPVIPHANTRQYFEHVQADPNFWLGATLELMRRCDGVFLTPNWLQSSGARAEADEAVELGLPIFRTLELLDTMLKSGHWTGLFGRGFAGDGAEIAQSIEDRR